MAKSLLSRIDVMLDEDGFMREPNTWNTSIAKVLAEDQGIPNLSEDHWKAINYLRDYYFRFHIPPPVAMLRKENGFNLKHVYELFPSGLAESACKIAGLPRAPGLYPS